MVRMLAMISSIGGTLQIIVTLGETKIMNTYEIGGRSLQWMRPIQSVLANMLVVPWSPIAIMWESRGRSESIGFHIDCYMGATIYTMRIMPQATWVACKVVSLLPHVAIVRPCHPIWGRLVFAGNALTFLSKITIVDFIPGCIEIPLGMFEPFIGKIFCQGVGLSREVRWLNDLNLLYWEFHIMEEGGQEPIMRYFMGIGAFYEAFSHMNYKLGVPFHN